MKENTIICTVCPLSCRVQVLGDEESIQSVRGHNCSRGERFARDEFICPMRILTTTVRLKNASEPLLAVRSAQPIPKKQLFNCMQTLRKAVFAAPIEAHEILIHNIADTGVDIVASSTARKTCLPS